jgi:hypothetical protein
MKCIFCADTGWVCENHPRRPWEGPYGCDCGGAGMPCPSCNLPEESGAEPRLPRRAAFSLGSDAQIGNALFQVRNKGFVCDAAREMAVSAASEPKTTHRIDSTKESPNATAKSKSTSVERN